MPLGPVTGDNIARLIREGYPRDQAIAIALSHERKHNMLDREDVKTVATRRLKKRGGQMTPSRLKTEMTKVQAMVDALELVPTSRMQSYLLNLSHEKQSMARDILGDKVFDEFVWAEKPTKYTCAHCKSSFTRLPGERSTKCPYCHHQMTRTNPEKGPAGSMIDTQEEVNKFVARMDEETLFASAAYGRKPSVKDWESGKDFKAYQPRWVGGPYFSIRDSQRIYDAGYRRIVVGGSEGFNVDLIMQ